MEELLNQRKSQRINLIILLELTKRAESMVNRLNISLSEIIRRSLADYLDRLEKQEIEQVLIAGYQANAAAIKTSKRTGKMPTDSNKSGPIKRGDIYLVNLNPQVGFETGKFRPAIIIQNNLGNLYLPVTIVVLISSVKEITKPLPIMVFFEKGTVELDFDSYLDCGQIRTINKAARLVRKIGELPSHKIKELNQVLKISLARGKTVIKFAKIGLALS